MAKRLLKRIEQKLVRIIPQKQININANNPIISITFDDFPASAAHAAMTILNEYGLLATYFLASDLIDTIHDEMEICSAADVIKVANAGHEIACHTFSHFDCNNITLKNRDFLRCELVKNAEKIKRLVGTAPCSFAYPFGAITFYSRNLIAKNFAYARGIDGGINFNKIDCFNLKANQVYSESFSVEKYNELINTAREKKGWLIFFTHDVSLAPTPYGCTIEQFRLLIDLIVQSGIKVLPVKKAIAQLKV